VSALLLAWLAVAAAEPTPTPTASGQSTPAKARTTKSKPKPSAPGPADPAAPPAASRKPLATPENPVEVSCDKGRMDGTLRQFICVGHVKMVRNTTTLTCDRSVAHYLGKDATQVTRLECFGNVEAVSGDRWARGDYADYDTVKEVLVMTGNPQARQGNNTMFGERVVFYVDTDLIEVQKVQGTLESKGKEPGAKKTPPPAP
jgi:lipopolysaccharide export system protein LptA